MALDKRYFEIAQKRLAERRNSNKHTEDMRRMEIHQKIPEYSELECRLAETMTRIVAAVAAKAADSSEQVKAAVSSNMEIQRQMAELLEKADIRETFSRLSTPAKNARTRERTTANGASASIKC